MARESGGRGYVLLAIMMLLIMAWNAAAARRKYAVEKNNLGVTSPDYIKGTYDSAIANFGIPLYAGTMMGSVVYREENRMGCMAYNTAFDSRPGGLPTIVLVDRGDCYFAFKVWNAQCAGAAAVLVSDNREEPLKILYSPEEDTAEYFQKVTIPSALIEKNLGDKFKKALSKWNMVNINLVWRDFVPHTDQHVEYELWTDGTHEWGLRSTVQMEFLKNFKGVAQILEKSGYTQFTPHYITWYCPQAFTLSKQCKTHCINQGRYCALGLEKEFSWGYDGKDVVIDNLRQLCVFKVAKEDNRPWVWWDYVTDFNIRCPMIGEKYIKECADSVIKSLSLDSKKVEKCMGDPNADTENPILKAEQGARVGHGSRGAVTISPTLVINDRQYRGKLDKANVMKAICSGYKETIQPAICLNNDMKTDECLLNNGGCWEDKKANITACKDTFRGRVCKCPLVNGVQFKGDGYTHCDGSILQFRELSSGVVDKKDGSELWIRKMVRAVSRLEIDFSWRKLYI